MRSVLKVIFVGCLLAYPFLVYFGLNHLELGVLIAILCGIAVVRIFALFLEEGSELSRKQAAVAAVAMISLAGLSFLMDEPNVLQFYPAIINGAMLLLFATSLFYPPTIIERLARISEPDLPPDGVAYTRRVTMVWCGFFILNGAASLFTVFQGDIALWAFYNGLLSYILMGTLFAGEFFVRGYVKRRRIVG